MSAALESLMRAVSPMRPDAPVFGGLIAFIVIGTGGAAAFVMLSTAMIWLRLPQLRTTAKLESLVSREAAFLYNNLLLVALCLTIRWGTEGLAVVGDA